MSAYSQFVGNSKVPESFKTINDVISHIQNTLRDNYDATCHNIKHVSELESMLHYGTFNIKVSNTDAITIYSCIPFQRGDDLETYLNAIHSVIFPGAESVPEPFNGAPIESIRADWFDIAAEFLKFFEHTLNRWGMNTCIINDCIICHDEGFAIQVQEQAHPVFEITLLSNKKHIDTMIIEIFECLRVQVASEKEMSEDEAYALLNRDFATMNEYQVQLYSSNLGRDCREEIDLWTVEHTGLCNNLLRVSYGKFTDAVICVDLKNLNNVCRASFKNCRISSSCCFENITFVECSFDNVEFECALKNVKFDNCVLQKISWPTKNCGITVHNDEEDDDERSYSEYEDDM